MAVDIIGHLNNELTLATQQKTQRVNGYRRSEAEKEVSYEKLTI